VHRASRTSAVFACALLLSVSVAATEIHVMTSGAFTAAYLELLKQFENQTKHKISTDATSMGTGADYIPNRVSRGEPADVVILNDTALDDMIKKGLVVAGSRVDLARSGIGMAVRSGAPKPDISSVEALRRTLLAATSIAYSASVSGDYLSTQLFQRLGIADQVMKKSRRIDGERVGAVVARGEAQLGFQQTSELLPVPGIDYVGPLPADAQLTTTFSAGIASHAASPDVARAFIAFLASPAAAATITKTGMEPMASKP
jgi:molybdate transport system substrate-binding protein